MKKLLYLFTILIFLYGCSNKKFNSEIWKTNENEQFYMLNNLVEKNILKGKSKKEIIDLLDTIQVKQFNYNENSWMYIIKIPNSVPATKTPVEVLDIYFQNGKVIQTSLRN